MHYYQFNIGDYRRKTMHLSVLEHGVYRVLLDSYYLNEKPLPSDHAKLMRTHSIRTANEKAALQNVLDDFFSLTDDGYVHHVCDDEIKKYREKSEKASASAKARWGKNANAMRTHSEGNANHKPITNNHKPIINTNKARPKDAAQVEEYAAGIDFIVDGQAFIDHYEANGWMRGKNKVKDWKACVRTWKRNRSTGSANGVQRTNFDKNNYREEF